MAEENWESFNTGLITAAEETIDWQKAETWASFAAMTNFSVSLGLIAELRDEFQDSSYAEIVRDAGEQNGIYVGQKGTSLLVMFFSTYGTVMMKYDGNSKEGTYHIFDEITSQGKLTIFLVGDYKERKIIDTFVHVNVENYASEYQTLSESFMKSHDKPDPSEVPPPNSSYWVDSGDYEGYIQSRVAWGEGYINDDGEFVEFD